MGGCASVSRNSESAMKMNTSLESKGDKLVIPPSPVKENTNNMNLRIKDVVLKSHSSHSLSATTFGDYGSKDEAFFDSRPWLDSDCEDDFYSVNGDFTPSRGSTPVHQSLSQVNKTFLKDKIPVSVPGVPSPVEKKKKLIDLFRESLEGEEKLRDELADVRAMVNGKTEEKQTVDIPPKSVNGTPFLSEANPVCSSERTTTNGDVLSEKHKQIRLARYCLPGLLSCSSFVERKKKMSPAIAVNDSLLV